MARCTRPGLSAPWGARPGCRRVRVGQRRVHRSSRLRFGRSDLDDRGPDDRCADDADPHDRRADHRRRDHGCADHRCADDGRRDAGTVDRHARLAATTTTPGRRDRAPSRCRSTTTIRTDRRSSSSSPGAWPRPGAQDRLVAGQPGRTRVRRARVRPLRRPDLRRSAARERFDIVGWDPRGTGYSEPAIDCIDDYDALLSGTDITPDDDAEHQVLVDLAQGFADACEANNADIIQHVGTNNSARDMDTMRQALGEDKISYFGFSYGSELGATWATLFPDTVRAAVLDGASRPQRRPAGRELAADRRASRARSTRTWRRAAPTRRARSTTVAMPRARSTR